jgi:hypothetical protein
MALFSVELGIPLVDGKEVLLLFDFDFFILLVLGLNTSDIVCHPLLLGSVNLRLLFGLLLSLVVDLLQLLAVVLPLLSFSLQLLLVVAVHLFKHFPVFLCVVVSLHSLLVELVGQDLPHAELRVLLALLLLIELQLVQFGVEFRYFVPVVVLLRPHVDVCRRRNHR